MLDNLKLGYGGTASEMARLINDSGVLGDTMTVTANNVNSVSFDKIIEAIHVVQENLGITGTSSKEAATTIQGSFNMVKGAWTNLITALADPKADLSENINDFVDTVVAMGENLLPAIEQALNGVAKLIEELLPVILAEIPTLINDTLPTLLETVVSMITTIVQSLEDNAEEFGNVAVDIIMLLIQTITENLPKIIKAALKIIVSLANGITKALPKLIPAIIGCIREIVDTLTNPKQLAQIINAALDLVITLVEGIIDNLDELMDAAIQIILNIVEYLLTPKNLAKLISAALRIQIALAGGLIKAIPQVIKGIAQLIMKIGETITHHDWGSFGKNIVDGVFNGLKNAWNSISSWWSDSWNGLVDSAKNWLGIHSPSRVFKRIGEYTAEGFGIGWKDEFADVSDDVGDDLDFSDIAQIPNDYSTGIETTSYISKIDDESSKADQPIQVSLNIENFSNNTDDDLESIVDKLMEMMSEKTNRRGFVYA